MVQVILMRGVSGAGKSTWVEKNLPTRTVVSADYFQHDEDGIYRFRKERAPEAHNRCFKNFMDYARLYAQDEELSSMVLVVDNTNCSLLDIAPYYRVAEALGHPVKIVEIKCDPHVAAARTTHGAPGVTIGAMHQALVSERIPTWWNREVYDQEGNLVFKTPYDNGPKAPDRP